MDYQNKKKQILEEVSYTNLLTFSIAQNRLQRNFRSLVDALMLSQEDTNVLRDELSHLKNKTSQEIKKLSEKVENLEGKLSQNQCMSQKKPSIHKSNQSQVLISENRISEAISQPKLKLNYVQTEKDLEDYNDQDNLTDKFDHLQKINDEKFKEIQGILNILRHDSMQNSNVNKDLSNIRDQINALRAQIKTINDRSQKSIKRVSLNAIQNTQTARQSQNHLSPEKPSNKIQEQIQKQINNIYIELNTVKLCLQQSKQMSSDLRRKQNRLSLSMQELQKGLKKLNDKQNEDMQKVERQIKDIKMQQLLGNTQSKKQASTPTKSQSNKHNDSSNNNNASSKQINQKLNKIQGALTNLISQNQLNRVKKCLQQKINSLQSQNDCIRKQLKDQVQMLMQINDEKTQKLKNLQKQTKQINDEIKQNASHFERKNNITLSKIDQLKKNLQNLKEDLQFYKTMNEDNKNQSTPINPNNYISAEDKDSADKKSKIDSKTTDQFKKYFNRKLHDQRTYLLGLIRDLQKKSNNKSGVQNDIINIWDKIGEINLFLNKKANDDDVKKHLAYMEKKITSIYNRLTSTDENNDDARAAKTSWFCLSCDKNLQNYQGKVGKHIIWDSMPLKANFTKYYNKADEKKSLPTLKR